MQNSVESERTHRETVWIILVVKSMLNKGKVSELERGFRSQDDLECAGLLFILADIVTSKLSKFFYLL